VVTPALPPYCAAFAFALRFARPCGALAAALGGASASAAPAPADHRAVHSYAASVAEAAQRFGIPELWIWRVMHAESRGNARAVSRAGAMGVMQIMPATWAMLSARHGLGSDPFDTRSNILAGAAYLRSMWDRYRDVPLMLAAYNAGPGRADAYASGRRRLPAETIAYVARIAPELGASGVASRATAPSPVGADWQRSVLFSARSDEASSVADRAAAKQSGDSQRVTSATIEPPNDSARHPLFIPLSGQDR
jgi:soluble lytic murein transglycosylase-like protein